MPDLTRRITYDSSSEIEPRPGELLDVMRLDGTLTGTRYLIVSVREVRQRIARPFHRWALSVKRLETADYRTLAPDPRIWHIRWYRRGESA